MEKCEWKNGEFIPCLVHREMMKSGGTFMFFSTRKATYSASYCPSCGADLKQPKPEAIIKQSGETFVCLFKGVDYFCVDPISCNGKARSLEMEFSKMPHIWQQIEGLEITDEIAKLRPVTILDDHNSDNARYRSHILYAVSETEFFTDLCHAAYKPDVPLRLATVSDLEDNSEKP